MFLDLDRAASRYHVGRMDRCNSPMKVRIALLKNHLADATRLACMEWHETEAAYRTGRFEPDTEAYLQWERQGLLRYFVLIDEGRIVGHTIFVVYKSRTTSGLEATEELVYIDPEHRRGWGGVRLLADAIEFLKLQGVGDIFVGSKLTARKPIDKLLQRLGGRHVSNLYVF
jgi:GNAT superfamily N-acetyltransferase